MRQVGIFEAKTHLSALVDAAGRGETIIVTRNGTPVAQIGPVETATPKPTKEQAIDEIRRSREELKKSGRGVSIEEILEWIAQGRRY
ncbi:MAG: type II toxin-antitoxin system prevent-host-death family antitoxin [Candidatus Eremiobacteraeota bacterium]|nr:type II toxin-antitoxin system prevent-host-death family antitoxin [Candidatus Eremiobacteraeota bacterium]